MTDIAFLKTSLLIFFCLCFLGWRTPKDKQALRSQEKTLNNSFATLSMLKLQKQIFTYFTNEKSPNFFIKKTKQDDVRSSLFMSTTIAFDDFSSNNGNGGAGWTGNWSFTNASVTSPSPGGYTTGSLIFMDGASSGTADRTVDLSTYTSATLTFHFECDDNSSGFENDDFVRVRVSTDGGSNFSNVWYRDGDQVCPNTDDSESQNPTVSIPVGNANTVIRLESGTNSPSEDIYWDNILVEGVSSGEIQTGNLSCAASATQITGTVFEDFNYNGIYDTGEYLGVKGMPAVATDSLGNTFNAVTASDGTYTLSGLTSNRTYRIEFTFPDSLSWAKPTFYNGDNGTTVQFVQPNNCANLGVANPADYCQSNPLLAVPCYVNGDPTGGGTSGTGDWMVFFRNNNQGEVGEVGYTSPETYIDGQVIGATWGMAYHRQTANVLAGAVMKRHSGFGQNGTGAIYKIDDTGTPSLFVDLNTYTNVNTGADTRGSANNILPTTSTTASRDINAFQAVGKVGLGDVELSDDEQYLYAINLNERTLIRAYVGNNLTAPATVDTFGIATAIETLLSGNSIACGTAADYRPWALKYHKGLLYIGVVCSAESSQTASDLHAYVLSFDPSNPVAGFSEVIDMAMDYAREPAFQSDNAAQTIPGTWRPWALSYTDATILSWNGGAHPSPILSDIEIDDDGSMILGFLDRFGMESGYRQLSTDLSDGDTDHQGISGGDVIRFCMVNGSLVQEGGTGCGFNTSPPWTNPGTFVPQGEFYAEEEFFTTITDPSHGHPETSLGGLALMPGSGEIVATVYDPFALRSGGVAWWDNTDGSANKKYELYESVDDPTPDGTFGKAAGFGDLELMCDPAPLEIGNYVWVDTDGDGVQGAGELGLEGVRIELFNNSGTLLAIDTTNNLGYYFFSGNNIDDATWQTTNDTLQPNTSYYIVAGGNGQFSNNKVTLNGTQYELTTDSVDTGTNRYATDSDGTIAADIDPDFNGEPYVQITTGNAGEVDHTFDFGFIPICSVNIIKTYTENCIGTTSFTADLQIIVSWQNGPANENINITYDGGNTQTILASTTGTSPDTVTINIAADATKNHEIIATFVTTTGCADTTQINTPVPCPADVVPCSSPATGIGGNVFEDVDYDGEDAGTGEAGVQGIKVYAYDCNGNKLDSAFTDADGDYLLNTTGNGGNLIAGMPYRIEFDLPESIACWAVPTTTGADNGTTVQFVTEPACASLGITSPTDYCDTNPYLATPCFVFGDQSDAGNPNSTDGVLVSFKQDWGEDNVAPIETSADITDWQTGGTPQYIALANQIGTTYGLAYDNLNNKMYVSAFLKNFAGFGDAGTAGIYEMEIDPKTGQVKSGTVQEFVQLNNLGISVCSDPHGTDLTTVSVLDNLINQVGKCGLGDLEISDDGQFLYTINLSTKEVVAIRIADGSLYGKWKVPENQLETPNPEVDIRPFALAYKRGKVFVGMMATAESTQNQNDIWAYVYEMNPTNGSFNQIFKGNYLTDFPFHYARPWQTSWANLRADAFDLPENIGNLLGHFSPILADIEFYGKDMTLSFRNRSSDQWGDNIPDPLHPTPNTLVSTIQGGELACVYWDGTTYQPETSGNCGGSRNPSQSGIVGYTGNTQVEFYWGDGRNNFYNGSGAHPDGSYGGLAMVGTNKLIWNSGSVLDAFGITAYDYGAVGILSQENGAILNGYGIYQGGQTDGVFGKSSGLGDLEAICTPPPLEIGNYVWEDINEDGIQDACESPLDSVILKLYNAQGEIVAIDTTDSNGQYYFNDENVRAYTAQNDTTLLADSTYTIVIMGSLDTPFGNNKLTINNKEYELTIIDATEAGHTNSDLIDSDGNITGNPITVAMGMPFITITTGSAGTVNHSLDFGFKILTCPNLTINLDKDTICGGEAIAVNLMADHQSGALSIYVSTTKYDTTQIYAGSAALWKDTTNDLGVIINEVFYANSSATDTIELLNAGITTLDISTYFLCHRFSYGRLNTFTLVSGNLTTFAPGDKVVLSGFNLNNSASDIGLYLNNSGYNNPANMVDFMQYGSAGNGRESVANSKGIWTSGDFINVATYGASSSISYDCYGDTSSDWAEDTTPSWGASNDNKQATIPIQLDTILTNAGTYYFYSALSPINANNTTACQPMAIDSIIVFGCDWGDLPDTSANTAISDYQTTAANNGPYHIIVSGLKLGALVDNEPDGLPEAEALGDNNDSSNDEDGVTIISTLNTAPGGTIRLPLSITNSTGNLAYLEAWIDWNGDGDFLDANEMVVNVDNIGNGVFSTHIEIMIPNNALKGSQLGFRVRYSNTDNMTPYGRVNSGEVEDYLLGIDCPQVICLPIETEIKRE